MSDFDPFVLFWILRESFGAWIWPLAGLAVLLLAAVLAAALRLRGGRFGRRLALAAGIGLAAAALLTPAVPWWTDAGPDALSGPVDVALAFALALVPAAVLAAGLFVVGAFRSRVR